MFFMNLAPVRNFAFKTIVVVAVVVGGLGNEAFLFNRSEKEKHFLKFSEKRSSQKPQENKAARN